MTTEVLERPPTKPAERFTNGGSMPSDAGQSAALLSQINEQLRTMRRERQHEDFSIGRLAAAIAQAFALCAIGWALFIWMDSSPANAAMGATRATIALLAGIAFQIMALTWLLASRRS